MDGKHPIEIGEYTFWLPYKIEGSVGEPANFRGHPDNWYPEEPDEREVVWEPEACLFFRVLGDLCAYVPNTKIIKQMKKRMETEILKGCTEKL